MVGAAEYRYHDAELNFSHEYLLPVVVSELRRRSVGMEKSVFDLGCGNGSVANYISSLGYTVAGIDPSAEGIAVANAKFPTLKLEQGSAYDDLSRFGRFSFVVSLEVIEHIYSPREYAANIFKLLNEGGHALISTPYHGYLKNLVLAASGAMDKHFTVLWDHGHIKFWSRQTLTQLLTEAGLEVVHFHRVGRIPPLAKSMIAIARRAK
jgi:2-polyprenyl-3-methyl-5-hydroxy-6-metoxy-1,4-benzoquinol methylase